MHETLIKIYQYLPQIKIGIVLLILTIALLLTLNVFDIRSAFGDEGVQKSMSNINKLRARDRYIQNSTRFIMNVTRIVQNTPFAINGSNADYLEYNLARAGVKTPGGNRTISAREFNALIVTTATVISAICFIIALIVNFAFGFILLLITWICASVMPLRIIRATVKAKDQEVRDNFSDFYLMLHYVLITGAKTSLSKIMKTYQKTASSSEMVRLVDICCGYIETYGDQDATLYIARDYREVQEVNKLMRLIKQLYDGSDITSELIGFRDELIKQKKYRIMRRMERVIKVAQASFNVLSIILIQAIVSAMAIYVPDMGGMSAFM